MNRARWKRRIVIVSTFIACGVLTLLGARIASDVMTVEVGDAPRILLRVGEKRLDARFDNDAYVTYEAETLLPLLTLEIDEIEFPLTMYNRDNLRTTYTAKGDALVWEWEKYGVHLSLTHRIVTRKSTYGVRTLETVMHLSNTSDEARPVLARFAFPFQATNIITPEGTYITHEVEYRTYDAIPFCYAFDRVFKNNVFLRFDFTGEGVTTPMRVFLGSKERALDNFYYRATGESGGALDMIAYYYETGLPKGRTYTITNVITFAEARYDEAHDVAMMTVSPYYAGDRFSVLTLVENTREEALDAVTTTCTLPHAFIIPDGTNRHASVPPIAGGETRILHFPFTTKKTNAPRTTYTVALAGKAGWREVALETTLPVLLREGDVPVDTNTNVAPPPVDTNTNVAPPPVDTNTNSFLFVPIDFPPETNTPAMTNAATNTPPITNTPPLTNEYTPYYDELDAALTNLFTLRTNLLLIDEEIASNAARIDEQLRNTLRIPRGETNARPPDERSTNGSTL